MGMVEMTENKEIKEFNTNHSSNAHKALVHSNFAKSLWDLKYGTTNLDYVLLKG